MLTRVLIIISAGIVVAYCTKYLDVSVALFTLVLCVRIAFALIVSVGLLLPVAVVNYLVGRSVMQAVNARTVFQIAAVVAFAMVVVSLNSSVPDWMLAEYTR